ncbi:amino acid adenylation domain-containing protein [Longispora sp. NPDC051575]|uniref:amino acid adenylation domain-containing protein n=1 Tax=Longispora sp. NPDC051575 TaxID=3154943 RepID=UPI0034412814
MTTVAHRILAQARRTPDAVAVRQWDVELTYRELVAGAFALAGELRAHGVGPESRVGICARRRPGMVVTVLGVLMSGAGYVPLDPDSPRQRLLDIVADAGTTLAVADEDGRTLLAGCGLDLVAVPGAPAPAVDLDTVEPGPAGPDNLAHLIHTSGSTGRPKGILTTHRNVLGFVDGCVATTGAGPDTRAFGFASLGFDAATIDLFVTLSVGGAVQLVGDADRRDPARLHRFLREHRVTWGMATPTVLALLDPTDLPDWLLVISGGEALPAELIEAWTGPGTPAGRRFLNTYGPTETTVYTVTGDLAAPISGAVPLGVPMPAHRAYVVDADLCLVGPGEEGELLIGGPGVARGYLDRPALTAASFVPDPFSGEPGARLYRTGDVVSWRPDGRLAFLGRRDGQIKLRGQRIEPGEIEAVLREHPGVDQAAVEAVEGPTGLELVAFVAPADAPDRDALRAHAGLRLTGPMLPNRFVHLDALPRTASNKVDRVLLRSLAAEAPEAGPAPVDPVTTHWRRILGTTPAPGDDFFAAGGHSIAVMRLVAALRADLRRDLTAEDVYAGRTVAGITDRIAARAPIEGPDLSTGNPPTLSPPQRRMWFHDQLALDGSPYNIALAERLRGPLDPAALGRALTAVAARHEVLRWRIPAESGVPYPVSGPLAEVPLPLVDLTDRPADLDGLLEAGAGVVLDLATGPLWRATLYRLAPDEHVLAVTLHHVVFDGWSTAPFFADLAAAYAGHALPAPEAGYADYAVWRAEREARDGDADLTWWLGHLRGAPTVVALPTARTRPAVQTYRGARRTVPLPAEVDAGVRRVAADLGATPAAVLLAAFTVLLRRRTGDAEHVLGAVLADRRLAAFDDLVGFCVDVVPARLRTTDESTFADHVRACRDELRAIAEHPSAPLERVVDALRLARDPSRPPLMQILFNVLNFDLPALALPGLRAEPVGVDVPGSPFDLTVYVAERAGLLAFDLLHNPDVYDEALIGALFADVVTVLTEAVAGPSLRLADLAPRIRTEATRLRTAPPAPVTRGAGGAPATETERLVAKVWAEVLGLDTELGVADNFFDIGGTSMAAVATRARLTELLGRELRVVDLFRYPNIRALASFLDGATEHPELARAAQRAAMRRGSAARRRTRGD